MAGRTGTILTMRAGTILGLAGLLALAGCGDGDSGGLGEGSYRIAVIPKGTTHVFWKTVEAGAKAAGKELGVDVQWMGPLMENNRDDQIKVVENFVLKGVDGIVIAPLDDTALQMSVRDAVNSDIPVMIIDSGLGGDDFISFIATDNFEGGKTAGRHMAEILGGSGKVIVLRYNEGSASTHNREEGFIEAAVAGGLEIVSSNRYGGVTTESAQTESENLLTRFSGSDETLTIDGIFCPNESSTFGMMRALQDMGLAGSVTFVGFDSSPKLIDALAAGEIHALVVQNPFNMGYLGVKSMVAHLNGETVAARIDTGAELVTKANMNEDAIKKLINPPTE